MRNPCVQTRSVVTRSGMRSVWGLSQLSRLPALRCSVWLTSGSRPFCGCSCHVLCFHPYRCTCMLPPQVQRQEAYVDFRLPAQAVHNHVRAMAGWPGARARLLREQWDGEGEYFRL